MKKAILSGASVVALTIAAPALAQNNTSTVTQTGSTQTASVTQSGEDAEATVIQSNSLNTATITQGDNAGGEAVIDQSGIDNDVDRRAKGTPLAG